MEIIHLILGKANPERLNGVNKVVYHMASEQVKAGKLVRVWGITASPVHDYPERNFITELFQAHKNTFSIDKSLKTAILNHTSAIFHLHGGWVPIYSTLARFFAKHKIQFVLTAHGAYNTVAMQRSGFTKKIYFQLFEKQILKKASRVHAIGKSEVDGLQYIFPNCKSFLLPYGFEPNTQVIDVGKNIDFTVGFVGRLDIHTKGLDLLLQAFYKFQKKYPSAKLWIVGDGEGREFIEKFIKENLLNNVVMWGKKFGEEKDILIKKMHVFAHPSRNEGLPTSVLEAAALGVPSIVTQATNVAQYVNEFQAGISIDNESETQLLSALEQIYINYTQGWKETFETNGKNMLEKAFSWSVLVHKFDQLYAK